MPTVVPGSSTPTTTQTPPSSLNGWPPRVANSRRLARSEPHEPPCTGRWVASAKGPEFLIPATVEPLANGWTSSMRRSRSSVEVDAESQRPRKSQRKLLVRIRTGSTKQRWRMTSRATG